MHEDGQRIIEQFILISITEDTQFYLPFAMSKYNSLCDFRNSIDYFYLQVYYN